jgi:hypothetical protein
MYTTPLEVGPGRLHNISIYQQFQEDKMAEKRSEFKNLLSPIKIGPVDCRIEEFNITGTDE